MSEELEELQREYNNYRKRSRREIKEAEYRAKAEMAISVVSLADDLNNAIRAIDDPGVSEGLEKLLEQVISKFEAVGLLPYGEEGEVFDPERHEAIAYVEGAEGKIVEVHRLGWETTFGKMIRPASVSVGGSDG